MLYPELVFHHQYLFLLLFYYLLITACKTSSTSSVSTILHYTWKLLIDLVFKTDMNITIIMIYEYNGTLVAAVNDLVCLYVYNVVTKTLNFWWFFLQLLSLCLVKKLEFNVIYESFYIDINSFWFLLCRFCCQAILNFHIFPTSLLIHPNDIYGANRYAVDISIQFWHFRRVRPPFNNTFFVLGQLFLSSLHLL